MISPAATTTDVQPQSDHPTAAPAPVASPTLQSTTLPYCQQLPTGITHYQRVISHTQIHFQKSKNSSFIMILAKILTK